uniref:sterile alpha motif domain-containing protein 9-like n=1 Tax=Scatophagus argus TaxID=75038 RepID=UPI001ED7D192|nr:sterile alpha motif domain-containing protein 9-like [Scatophagus argus]
MANGPGLSTRGGGIIYDHQIRDRFSLLDVLYANQFEGETINSDVRRQTEEAFYRGAPPKWLNFYISEQNELGGTPLIKRDGCETLKEVVQQSKDPVSTVKLFHEPGCGGTTLAMQVLWDLRKTFRCAVLTDNLGVSEITPLTSDVTKVAEEVVQLFTAGDRDNQNTVLLLLNDEQILEKLQDIIMEKIAERQIKIHMRRYHVAILLCCVRKETVLQSNHIILKKNLSDTERQQFTEKKTELSSRYSEEHEKFHGFNIMQANFSEDYVDGTCEIIRNVRSAHKTRKTQLASFLSLLNAYVPDSYLLESQCLDFLKDEHNTHGDPTLEDQMSPYSHLIITYQQDGKSDKRVCMAHPMIAQRCTELMAKAGVTRSDTAKDFLNWICQGEVPPFLRGFVKDMLTKREKTMITNQAKKIEEKQEKFSKLIQDIKNKKKSALVLKVASQNLIENPFYPQALARLYYIELMRYKKAEKWAKTAKERDPQNSFIADTLGQVHKNHLKNKKSCPAKPSEILQLAEKAIDAFKIEEDFAEKEEDTDMREDGNKKVSHVFNNRGLFGYLQVCNCVYDLLARHNVTWRRVLTNNVSLSSVLKSFGDNKIYRFNDLIKGIRGEVKRRCGFFDEYLTYSKPSKKRDDPSYIYDDVRTCYSNYVIDSPLEQETNTDFVQKLKESLSDNSAGVLSCFDREYSESELEEITTWWKTCQPTDSTTALVNYIFAHILLINTGAKVPSNCKSLTAFKQKDLSSNDAPELHMLALLLNWPTDSKGNAAFKTESIEHMRRSYENTYKKYLRSRHLHPLFFIGKGEDLNRIVHRKVLEGLFLRSNEDTEQDWPNNWNNEKIFEAPEVQDRLLKVEGRIRNYRVYAIIGGKKIKVVANQQHSLWESPAVTFYLGFTIRGPVAFGIKTVKSSELDSSEPGKIQPELSLPTATDGASGQHFVDRHQTALINRVSDTEVILRKLMDAGFISREQCDVVRALETSPDQMSSILHCLTSVRGKDALYESLKRMKSMRPLIRELEESE